MNRFKTGEKAPQSGLYRYDGPTSTDGISCVPTPEEMVIPLQKDETFPPVKSCGSAAYWRPANRS